MADHYVDSGAAPGGDGSFALPWDTIADVNAHVFVAGDNVYFKRGSIFVDATLEIDQGGSAAGIRLTFADYGSGAKPIITAVAGSCILCTSAACDHITVRNIACSGGVVGFLSADRHDIILDGVDVNAAAANAIFLTRINGFTVKNCTITNPTNGGIILYGQIGQTFGICNGEILDNTVTGAGSDGINVHSDDTGVVHPGDNFVFRGNTIIGAGEQCLDIGRDDGAGISNVIVEDNEISNTTGTIGMIAALINSTVRYNYFHDNIRHSISLVKNCLNVDIYYNIFYNDIREHILITDTVGATVANIRFWNNTFSYGAAHDVGYAAFNLTVNINYLTLTNNIVVSNGTRFLEYKTIATPNNTNTVSDYNCFYSAAGDAKFANINSEGDHTLAQWQTNQGQDLHSFWKDPIFGANFHLTVNSPCRNKGIDLGLRRDYEGNTVA